MLFILLDKDDNNTPMEIIEFKDNVDKQEIQKLIGIYTTQFLELTEDTDGTINGVCQVEWVLNKINEHYNCKLLWWYNDDLLYI